MAYTTNVLSIPDIKGFQFNYENNGNFDKLKFAPLPKLEMLPLYKKHNRMYQQNLDRKKYEKLMIKGREKEITIRDVYRTFKINI